MTFSADMAIAGAGPAGLALASSALQLGARVVVVDAAPERPWLPTWCAFQRDLPAWVPVAHTWSRARVELPRGAVELDGPYVEVHRERLQAELTERSASADRVRVRAAAREPGGLRLEDGSFVTAPHVVDCTGVGALGRGSATAFQTAWGLEIETDAHPWEPGVATWMDLRGLAHAPSFLYALPLDERRVFVEETALAARPAVPLEVLERRLTARLDRLGVRVLRVHRTERCVIPLDVPVQDTLAFGAAGAMVHPATGYLLARVLHTAGPVAQGILAGRGLAALRDARGGWAHSLHRMGLEVLLSCDGPALTAFFTSFFDAPERARQAFLAPGTPVGPTALAMARLFLAAPMPVRRDLVRPLLRRPSRPPSEMPCNP